MAKPRVTATDRLSNVIDVVGLGRRTGLLSAERDVGAMLEEAEVYFVSGNPIYATLGPLSGHAALDVLAQWSVCRFCFDPQAPQPIPNVSGVLPAVDPSSPSGFSYAYAPAASNPANGQASSAQYGSPSGFGSSYGSNGFGSSGSSAGNRSYSGQSGPASRTSWNSPPSGYPSGSLGGGRAGGPNSSSSGNLGLGGNAGASNSRWAASGVGFGNPTTPRAGSNPAMANPANPVDPNGQVDLQRRPRRAPDVRDLINVVTTYNLSRAHRTVLLLADGEHSILDLARLSGKPVNEVTTLLNELEGRGLIYYYQ